MNDFDLIEMLRKASVFNSGGNDIGFRKPPLIMDGPESGGFTGQMKSRNPYDTVSFGAEHPLQRMIKSSYDDIDPLDFTPEDKYSRMLADMIGQYPNRADEHPSIWRRLAAFGAGLGSGGPGVTREIMQSPYNRKVVDWKNKVDVVGKAASDERARNTQERIYSGQRRSEKLREEETERKKKYDDARIDIERHKLELANFRAKNPNWIPKEVKGGNIILVNPQPKQDGTAETIDTGIASGSLSDLEKYNMGVEKAEHMEEIRQGNRKEMEGIRFGHQRELIPYRSGVTEERQKHLVDYREDARNKRPTKPTGNITAQIAQDRLNRANEYMAAHPESKKYIHFDGRNVRIDDPSTGGIFSPGPSATEREKARKYIYGDAGTEPPTTNKTTGGTSKTPGTGKAAVPAGRIKVIKPDGTQGTIPANRKDEAIKAGWKVVQ